METRRSLFGILGAAAAATALPLEAKQEYALGGLAAPLIPGEIAELKADPGFYAITIPDIISDEQEGRIWKTLDAIFPDESRRPKFLLLQGGVKIERADVAPVINHYITINAMDAKSFVDFAQNNAHAIANAVTKAVENGQTDLINGLRQSL